METEYLNFHDAEHFSDFELPFDQNDLLDGSDSTLLAIVNTDFDYIDSIDASTELWGTEKEQNGKFMALSDSEVTSVIPKMENIKEDFAKVLSDWQEHIEYLKIFDHEEDIDLSTMNNHMLDKMPVDLPDDIFQSEIMHFSPEKKSHMIVSSSPKKISPSSPLIDTKPSLTNFSIPPDGILQSKSPVKILTTSKVNVVSPTKLNKEIYKPSQIESNYSTDFKMETEDCIDIETVSEHEPVLEAGDVKSLLEQFEASEIGLSQPIINADTKFSAKKDLRKLMKNEGNINRSELALLKKSTQSQESKLHRNIRDSLPKEVIDRIKASGRKKVVSVIPPRSNPSKQNRTNRVNDKRLNSVNKTSKIVRADSNIANRIDGSVQLDHDYCSTLSPVAIKSNCDKIRKGRKKTTNKHPKIQMTKDNESVCARAMRKKYSAQSSETLRDNCSRKDSGLESGDVSDASEEPIIFSSVSNPLLSLKTNNRVAQMNSKFVNDSSTVNNDSTTIKPPLYDMKIRSALATSILQSRDNMLTKTKSIENSAVHKPVQMVSVLKKPPMNTNIITKNSSNESIVTTKNSFNDEVQNIIIQDIPAPIEIENEKKPVRRKLNLAEYRSRRDQGKSDSSRTCSPIQPMTLVYIHHASTTTEPIKNDSTNWTWSEREIVSVLKPKSEVEEDIKRLKPKSCDVSSQTNDSSFNNIEKIITRTESLGSGVTTTTKIPSISTTTTVKTTPVAASTEVVEIEVLKKQDSRESRLHEKKQRNYRQHRSSSGSNRSRLRSRSQSHGSRSRSRSRSADSSRTRSHRRRSSRNRSRSLSRRRTQRTRRSRSRSSSSRSASRSRSLSRRRNVRRRRISRRSSVSSSSTWSSRSRSRSRSRSTYRSQSRSDSTSSSYSRSRSSRSQSSSRYSSCSRSSSYRRSNDVWCHQEKKRQVEERRVIYVGRLEETITKADLRRRFEVFGRVVDISLHFREHRDNYGFVTFAHKTDAYKAIGHGNDDPSLSRYDLCFGGRRAFCKVRYADLDGMASNSLDGTRNLLEPDENNSFDLLLKKAKATLRNRKV